MRHELWIAMLGVSQVLDQVVVFENGMMDEQQAIMFFQKLIDSGLAWTLPGYGAPASELIIRGVCFDRGASREPIKRKPRRFLGLLSR